jgi:hypothetical protein
MIAAIAKAEWHSGEHGMRVFHAVRSSPMPFVSDFTGSWTSGEVGLRRNTIERRPQLYAFFHKQMNVPPNENLAENMPFPGRLNRNRIL